MRDQVQRIARMKWSRLWQPRRLPFWLMLMFNLLSTLCAWALRTLQLNTSGLMLIASVGLLNCGLGMWIAWRLLNEPDVAPDPNAQ